MFVVARHYSSMTGLFLVVVLKNSSYDLIYRNFLGKPARFVAIVLKCVYIIPRSILIVSYLPSVLDF